MRRSTAISLGLVGLVVLLVGVGLGSAGASGTPSATRTVTATSTVTATATRTVTKVGPIRTVVKAGPTRTVTKPGPTRTVTVTEAAGDSQGSADCTPGYSPCIPPGSDVDCAGGSGNGPRYVSGPVYVTGPDIYDLDRDGDGVACE